MLLRRMSRFLTFRVHSQVRIQNSLFSDSDVALWGSGFGSRSKLPAWFKHEYRSDCENPPQLLSQSAVQAILFSTKSNSKPIVLLLNVLLGESFQNDLPGLSLRLKSQHFEDNNLLFRITFSNAQHVEIHGTIHIYRVGFAQSLLKTSRSLLFPVFWSLNLWKCNILLFFHTQMSSILLRAPQFWTRKWAHSLGKCVLSLALYI